MAGRRQARTTTHRAARGTFPGWPAAALAWLAKAFLAERERWPLWLPVCLGGGIALYFSLSFEPPWMVGAGAVPILSGLSWLLRRRPAAIVCLALLTLAVGFCAAQVRSQWVAGPVIKGKLGPLSVAGDLTVLETRQHGVRITLEGLRMPSLGQRPPPRRIRLSLRGQLPPEFEVGARVRLRAVLLPPAGPAAPGAYDFARAAWFKGLGAVGYGVSRPEVLAVAGAGAPPTMAVRLAAWRRALFEHLRAALPGEAGAVAVALMTGERGAISEATWRSMRDSGLAHLLAISGLHIGLMAGWLFFAVRLVLALAEPLALRAPIKKWAAAIALAGAFAYLLLTGATVPTQRAFLMVSLVLLAVMLDRKAVSFRLVAWAATMVLLWAPESLLSVSFQMSFAAVVALTAVYEGLGPRLLGWRGDGGTGRRLLLYLAAVLLTTLVAGAATAPFALYHFNRAAMYGLAANLFAVPITALWVMPCALLAFVLLPLGLEQLALLPMQLGVGVILAVAAEVASWPGAVSLLPAFGVGLLAAISLGGLWLCLWRGRWRLAGAVAVALALAMIGFADPPDFLIDGKGKAMAARLPDGRVVIAGGGRRQGITVETWLRRWGVAAPDRDAGAMRCDRLGCVLRQGGDTIAYARDPRALQDDCQVSDVLLAAVPVRRGCPSASLVIDRFDLWRRGAVAVWRREGGIRAVGANDDRGDRPWSRHPGSNKRK